MTADMESLAASGLLSNSLPHALEASRTFSGASPGAALQPIQNSASGHGSQASRSFREAGSGGTIQPKKGEEAVSLSKIEKRGPSKLLLEAQVDALKEALTHAEEASATIKASPKYFICEMQDTISHPPVLL